MRQWMYWGLLAAGVLAMAGCQSPGQKLATDEPLAADVLTQIADKRWTLQEMTIEGTKYPLAGRIPTLHVQADGQLFGLGSVNRYFGAVQVVRNGRLQWSDGFGATKMAGPPEAMKQEEAYLKSLVKTELMKVEGNRLVVYSQDKQTVLTFATAAE